MLSRLDSSCLLIRRRALLGAIVPDPSGPGRRNRLAQTLCGAGAVVGHPVTLEHLPASVQIAETAATLQRSGILADDPVFADEHLDAILVHRDPRLLAALRRRALAPLDELAPAVRERLVETLTSWLRHFGDRRAMAAELHVHPQTVRYRMGRLHALFGSTLDTPESRARLVLALAWSHPSTEPGDSSASVARNAAANRSASAEQAGRGADPDEQRAVPAQRADRQGRPGRQRQDRVDLAHRLPRHPVGAGRPGHVGHDGLEEPLRRTPSARTTPASAAAAPRSARPSRTARRARASASAAARCGARWRPAVPSRASGPTAGRASRRRSRCPRPRCPCRASSAAPTCAAPAGGRRPRSGPGAAHRRRR